MNCMNDTVSCPSVCQPYLWERFRFHLSQVLCGEMWGRHGNDKSAFCIVRWLNNTELLQRVLIKCKRWKSKMLEKLTNQYIFMRLITGCAKMIPFHYHVRCQTATNTERCQITNQCRLYRNYESILFFAWHVCDAVELLCFTITVNCFEQAVRRCLYFTVNCIGC